MDDPTVVSPTIQEWNGERFYRCGLYFQHNGRRLHRLVREAVNGPVPKGQHVHHIDLDRANNRLANLEARPAGAHLAEHSRNPSAKQRAARRRNVAIV